MPIKAENKGRYPANWSDIRRAILERAGNCCEKCKAQNGAMIARGAEKDDGTTTMVAKSQSQADTGCD